MAGDGVGGGSGETGVYGGGVVGRSDGIGVLGGHLGLGRDRASG